ncbi:MAG TPA: phenylalanine--tRNA ligase subunit beta [Candidatus Paceibacterota bacterium]|nr:phenylalanine--tRNA ligase subunit beta [Candidatus Paceibacterota bacterium]
MKFSYSLLKKLVPRLPAAPKVAEALTMRAFEVEGVANGVLDLKLYSNRYSDAASHIGIAREAAAAFGLPFKSPVKEIINPPADLGLFSVRILDKRSCPRYQGRYFEMPLIPASPAWMKAELQACGLKPINAVVDIMNYVMLETGQPLHAFDYDKLAGGAKKTIIVRRAKRNEKFEALDGQKFVLDPETLVIAGSDRALAIAGIKGGMDSGVTGRTRRIIVEAANFAPANIWQTSRRLKLLTDASIRFDHGLSPVLVDQGLDRAAELLKQICNAKLKDSVDIYPKPASDEVIGWSGARFEHLIGATITLAAAKKALEARGFSIEPAKKSGDDFLVRVPAWRTDVESFEDLAEEVVRLIGLNTGIKPKMPGIALRSVEESETVVIKDKLRQILVQYGLDEVYLHSFMFKKGPDTVELLNPASAEYAHLRNDLAGGLAECVVENTRFFEQVRIFETGAVFRKSSRGVIEEQHLAVALATKKGSCMLEMKGLMEDLLHGAGIVQVQLVPEGESLRIESEHHVLGDIRERDLGKNWSAAIAELDLGKLQGLAIGEREFRPLPKYPAVMRDVSLLVSGDTRVGDILRVIEETSPELVDDVNLIDEYDDPNLGGKRSLTFRLVFQSEERTLTDTEVNQEMEKITHAVGHRCRAEVR